MSGLAIGALARMTELAPSAIRYYEKAGLLPKSARQSGQRRFGADAIGRLRMIQLARAAGFSIAETRAFLTGFTPSTPPAARWRALAQQKLAEIDIRMTQLAQMQKVLKSSFRCKCPAIDDCARLIAVR
jgi:MerR family transcriptional regulator, redox-sensitive transcriptional activator SoxR